MKDTGYRVRSAMAAALFALLWGMGIQASAATDPKDVMVYAGQDTGGISAMRFNADTGRLTSIGLVAEVPKPRWSVAHPQVPILYVASDGVVIAYAVDRATGALTKVNEATAGGAGTTHLSLDAQSMTLLAANFGGGTTSTIALNRDGSLGALMSTIKSVGTGPHRRQTSPHAHGVEVDPSGRYALVADLGADRVFVYGFDRASRALLPDDAVNPRSLAVPPGSGPHHTAFGLSGRFVYLLNELSADITTLRWDAQQGRLATVQTLPISTPEFQGTKSGSELAVSRDGRFVYVGNRGENTLLVYRVNADTGELSVVQRLPAGGEALWSFAIHSSGKWLLTVNQRSNRVNVFGIDPVSGRLSETGQSVDSPAPISITFME